MRLTKLKLAGFKSFVDPTTIALPGQLVGAAAEMPTAADDGNLVKQAGALTPKVSLLRLDK